MMRVLHLTAGKLFGGVETFLVTLAESRALAPGMEPEFALCFPGRLNDELQAAGATVHDLGAVRWSRPWTLWSARRRLKALLKQNKYDIVVLHQPWIQAGFGAVVAAQRLPMAFYFHNPYDDDRFMARACTLVPRLVLAPSQDSLTSFKHVFAGALHRTVYYPLSERMIAAARTATASRDAIRTRQGAAASDVVILQASRVEAWKGPDQVIRALAECRDLPGWQFWFAGAPQRASEEQLFAEMQSLAQANGIADRVHFLGHRSDIPALMSAADLYTQGNRGPEGFGISFLEASYRGIPSITPRLGAVVEWMNDTMSILTTPEDVGALSAALRSLIVDPVRRQAMGEAAHRQAVRLCDTQQQLNLLQTLLSDAQGDAQ